MRDCRSNKYVKSANLKDFQNINRKFVSSFNLKTLQKKLNVYDDWVTYYIIDSVKYREKMFKQEGSGPNFEGDAITLCTCKHSMRALGYKIFENAWIACITSKQVHGGPNRGNYLYALFRIKKFCVTYTELSNYLRREFGSDIINIKSVYNNPLGDLFELKKNRKDEYRHESYIRPPIGYCHRRFKDSTCWFDDIEQWKNSRMKKSKPHKLLVGDPKLSFVWERPFIQLKAEYKNIYSGARYKQMEDFLKMFH